MSFENIKIIGLTGGKHLANKISEYTGIEMVDVTVNHFADGEIFVKHNSTVRHQTVIVVQSLIKPVNESIMELLICLDALKRAAAERIIVITPYYAYARQDRKANGREPITSKLLASLLEVAGANHVVILDVHSSQTQGFFSIPVDTLSVSYLLIVEAIKKLDHSNLCVVAPDYGGVKRTRDIAKLLNCSVAILDKRRPKPNQAEILNVLGDVKDKDCLIVDDMIDTAGTICLAAQISKKQGAKSVNVLATHGILSDPAKDRLKACFKNNEIKTLYLSNTIPYVSDFKDKHVVVVDISNWLAGIVDILVSHNKSLSEYMMSFNHCISDQILNPKCAKTNCLKIKKKSKLKK